MKSTSLFRRLGAAAIALCMTEAFAGVANREARVCQAKFLKAFAEHVNRFTKQRYADDSAVVAFELINEPHYPPGTPDEKVVEYVNTLADAIRSSGTSKPIFYNCWQKRQAALSKARVDGVTGSYYPTWARRGAPGRTASSWGVRRAGPCASGRANTRSRAASGCRATGADESPRAVLPGSSRRSGTATGSRHTIAPGPKTLISSTSLGR